MAQEKNERHTGRSSGTNRRSASDRDEFDDAVTSDISGLLYRAFGENADRDPTVAVTDMDVSAHAVPDDELLIEPGFRLSDRFEIVELVHSGGMGHVYRAIDHRRHREGAAQSYVAIKMLRQSLAGHETARFALEREASRAQALSHPNIINIFDFDEHDGQFYLVMEWLDGESVNALLRRTSGRRVAPEFAWAVIRGAAAALQYAHINNVVHADVNPSNIFITDTHNIKLLDFGVARNNDEFTDSGDESLLWVTQTYASPEVLSGLRPTFEDDIFSLGCVAYRLLSGRHPFAGSPSIVAQHRGEEVAPIAGLPAGDWSIIREALAYRREDRPTSIARMLGRAVSIGDVLRTGEVVQRRWLGSSLAAVAVIAAVAAGGWWLSRSDAPPPESAVTTAAEPAEQTLPEQPVVAPGVGAPESARADAILSDALDALRRGSPGQASAALAAANEADPGNPGIAIVEELITATGDRQLADARLALAEGDMTRAGQLLNGLEQFRHVSPATVAQLRRDLASAERESRFLSRLASAEERIAAGRLILADGGSAERILLELRDGHANDPRLAAVMERLGSRLLTRAAFATAAGRYEEATAQLDAVAALDLLGPEVAAARQSLAAAQRTPPAPSQAPDAVAAKELAADGGRASAPVEPITIDARRPGSLQDLVTASAPARPGPDSTAAAATPDEPPVIPAAGGARQAPTRSIEELGLERFVPPTFPRSARRRDLSGYVELGFDVNLNGRTGAIEILDSEPGDVFAESAAEAVEQWRFAKRDDVVRAIVTLRFVQEQ